MTRTLLQLLVALVSGFIFALGLGISGMTNPVKVYSFMDIFGRWDPTLIFVMVGAISVHFISYLVIKRQKSPVLAQAFQVPKRQDVTFALIIGSVLFGIGWGLAGYCPGPAVVSLASFEYRPIIFVLSMVVGMFLYQNLDRQFKFRK